MPLDALRPAREVAEDVLLGGPVEGARIIERRDEEVRRAAVEKVLAFLEHDPANLFDWCDDSRRHADELAQVIRLTLLPTPSGGSGE